MHTYIPRGVCSRQIDVELDGDTIKSVQFTGGLLTGLFCVPELSWTDFGGLLYTCLLYISRCV